MKKRIHKTLRGLNPRGIATAIAVLLCCSVAARATDDKNTGTNFIAFTEQQGDRSMNLVLSKLELAMMAPSERERMLADLEEQYGKPVAWASRAGRSNSKSVFASARDQAVEQHGLRLRARKVRPVPPLELTENSSNMEIPHPEESTGLTSPLLGVNRSDVLTWKRNQDSYLVWNSHKNGNWFQYNSNNKWVNSGFNIGLDFGLPGWFSPVWNGFSVKTKMSADIAGRFEYNQWWYKVKYGNTDYGWTRNVSGSASLNARGRVEGIITWGHDWHLWRNHYWGLGVEARFDVGLQVSATTKMNSSNTRADENNLTVDASPSVYVEAQGSVWIGDTTHKDQDDDWHTEGHKLIFGAKGQIVFVSTAGFGMGFVCKEWDWVNSKDDNNMHRYYSIGNTSISGNAKLRAEIKMARFTFQQGYELWTGSKRNDLWRGEFSAKRHRGLDLLL